MHGQFYGRDREKGGQSGPDFRVCECHRSQPVRDAAGRRAGRALCAVWWPTYHPAVVAFFHDHGTDVTSVRHLKLAWAMTDEHPTVRSTEPWDRGHG